LYKFLKSFEDPEEFNEEFIHAKRNDDVLGYVLDIARALEVVEGIEFLGGTMNADEASFPPRVEAGTQFISVEESRLDAVTLRFRVKGSGKSGQAKEEEIERTLLFPKLLDDFYFYLNGSKYFPIWQVIDASTYHTSRSLTLKTLLMPLILRKEEAEFDTSAAQGVRGRVFHMDLFRHRVNILLYFFSQFGPQGALEYLGYGESMVVEGPLIGWAEGEVERVVARPDGLGVAADPGLLASDPFARDIAACCLDLLSSVPRSEHAGDRKYWRRRLGATFTRNANAVEEKADKITLSFLRILDDRTKKILRVPPEDKQDTFSVVRWMLRGYDELSRMDNMDLRNKRMRVYEYLIHPLLLKFSSGTYRLLNSRRVTFESLKSIFNIKPGFVIKRLITNELLRYDNAVNGLDLFASALKWSGRGPQSIADGGKSVNIRYRGLHPSYIGRISLTSANNSDPGLSGSFVPFLSVDGLFFSKPEEGIVVLEEEEEEE
jgi:hypothetical protein